MMPTLHDLQFAFKEARRHYAVALIAADDAHELMREALYYQASLLKRRISAAENALKHGHSQVALDFLNSAEGPQ